MREVIAILILSAFLLAMLFEDRREANESNVCSEKPEEHDSES